MDCSAPGQFMMEWKQTRTKLASNAALHRSNAGEKTGSLNMVPNLQSQEERPYILLIEHDAELRQIMELSLQQAGLVVVAVSRYANALQLLNQKPPEIFIIDFDLRDGDPGELIAAYCQDSSFSAGTVVVTTTERLKDEWRRAHQPDAVVYKPFDMRYLIRLIRMLPQKKDKFEVAQPSGST